jgi:flagellar basal-body rod protein FlgG
VGPPQATSNPLDVAINGAGFFKVARPDGTFAYTRDGSFKVDANGSLVTSDGMKIEPAVTIPTGASAISISTDGVISVNLPGSPNSTPLSPPLQLTMFANPAGMTRLGQNLYQANAASGDPVDGKPGENGSGDLRPGFLEGSNVQVVEEMVRMILAQRSYEINSKAIQTSDEMLSTLNGLKR